MQFQIKSPPHLRLFCRIILACIIIMGVATCREVYAYEPRELAAIEIVKAAEKHMGIIVVGCTDVECEQADKNFIKEIDCILSDYEMKIEQIKENKQ